MSIGVLQSTLFGDMFGTASMRAVFGETAFLARCAEVEAALVRAQARLGIVPEDAAAAISEAAAAVAADPALLDLDRLRRETETVGYPILPLVRQLADRAGPGGLGTWSILWLVEECRRQGLPYVYLGYWIAESPKMAYKSRFPALERLSQGEWVPFLGSEE